jgi:hypothetical protein
MPLAKRPEKSRFQPIGAIVDARTVSAEMHG